MQLNTVIQKMEEYVQDFRAQLEKKDPASVEPLVANMRTFFDDLEGKLPANADSRGMVDEFKDCAARFGEACRDNNMEKAAKTLSDMEGVVASLRRQCGNA